MGRDELVARASQLLRRCFDVSPDAVGVAPGRVELLGNHTDYNEGWVLTAAVAPSTAVAVRLTSGQYIRAVSEHPDYLAARFSTERWTKATGNDRWTNYLRGVLAEFEATGISVPGADIAVVSDVPDGSGVSSSAALLVATAIVFEHLLAPGNWTPMQLAQLCRRAENGSLVGAPLLLDCRTLEFDAVPLPGSDCAILIANTGVRHALAEGGGYRARRDACFRVARAISGRDNASLRDVFVEQLAAAQSGLPEDDLRRARHVLTENLRVLDAADALRRGDWSGFGNVVNASHASCRDVFENSCPEVDLLVDVAVAAGAYGAKLTGGGWGGSAVILHPPAIRDTLTTALNDAWSRSFSGTPLLIPTPASDGAQVFVP
jgi:galactokinase